MTIGARTIKTGLAVAFSIFLCNLLALQPSIFAGAVTALAIQPSIGLSLVNAKEQALAHLLSIAIAIVLGLSLGSHPLVIALSTILVIVTCQYFRWKSGMMGGIMAAIFILGSPPAEFLNHAILRSVTIFIGAGVGLLVNMTIAPPRYDKLLQEKFVELNNFISRSFFQAVQSFLSLVIPTREDLESRMQAVESLSQECQRFYEMLLVDKKNLPEKGTEEQENRLLRDYLIYNKGLWQRTQDIFVLAGQRRNRRKETGDLPVSNEFQEILELLKNALDQFNRHNQLLQEKLQGKAVELGEENPVWDQLDQTINNWHDQFPSGTYYRHALIGVSLVADKTRWADREVRRLLSVDAPGGNKKATLSVPNP